MNFSLIKRVEPFILKSEYFLGETALLKRFFLLFCLSVLSSCSQDLIYSETAPSWVNDIRSGKSSLKVNNGDKILFRTNYKGTGRDSRADVCAVAIEKNISYIKKAYPFSIQIPMTVELVFFDPTKNDCSTTISVSRQLMEKVEALSKLNGQYEKEIKRIKIETEKIQADLNEANDEKEDLEQKIEKLNKLIIENKSYEKKIKTIEDFIEYARDERRQIKKKVEDYIYTGMSVNEVAKIMHGHDYEVDYFESCSDKSTRYKDFILCGVQLPRYHFDKKSGYVTKICRMDEEECYTKKINY
ncbi:MAG: hypothetical protein IJ752_06850 [Alphaproteobacteria bacterium]|nr:hypothetical protein [Alphaproteobacteria bacterium]